MGETDRPPNSAQESVTSPQGLRPDGTDRVDGSGSPAECRDAIADGREHRLAPEVVRAERVAGWIFAGPVAAASLATAAVLYFMADPPTVVEVLVVVAAAVFSASLAWAAHVWPALHYRYRSYRVTPLGIQIRRGVLWRTTNSIPRSRVQHTDVSQGPIERRFGLAHLVIHTAGTMSASVTLEGLRHDTAILIRNHLLGSGEDDAV